MLCAIGPAPHTVYIVRDSPGRVVLGPSRIRSNPPFCSCAVTARLDFSAVRRPGTYRVEVSGPPAASVRIAMNVYDGGASLDGTE